MASSSQPTAQMHGLRAWQTQRRNRLRRAFVLGALGGLLGLAALYALPEPINPLVMTGIVDARDSDTARSRRAATVTAAIAERESAKPRKAAPSLATETRPSPLPRAALAPADLNCLARAIYFEARGDNMEAQVAIAQLAMNRASRTSQSLCQVIAAKVPRDGCMFPQTCAAKAPPTPGPAWQQALWVADDVAAGRGSLRELEHADRFHHYLNVPTWRQSYQRIRRIGPNVFFAAFDARPDLRMARAVAYRWDREDEAPVAYWAPHEPEGQHQILSAVEVVPTKTPAARPIVARRIVDSPAPAPAPKASVDARSIFPTDQR